MDKVQKPSDFECYAMEGKKPDGFYNIVRGLKIPDYFFVSYHQLWH
jgi:hypothetical protein